MTNLSFFLSLFVLYRDIRFFFLSGFLSLIAFILSLFSFFSQLHFSKHTITSLSSTWCTHYIYNLHYSQTIAMHTYNSFYNFNHSLGHMFYSVQMHQISRVLDTHS